MKIIYKDSCNDSDLDLTINNCCSIIDKLDIQKEHKICLFDFNEYSLILYLLLQDKKIDNVYIVCPTIGKMDLSKQYGINRTVLFDTQDYETQLYKATDFLGFDKMVLTKDYSKYIEGAVNLSNKNASIIFLNNQNENKIFEINSYKFITQCINLINLSKPLDKDYSRQKDYILNLTLPDFTI